MFDRDSLDKIKTSFETVNQFRLCAPESVASGMIALNTSVDDVREQKENMASLMDFIAESTPKKVTEAINNSGKKTTTEVYLYKPIFTEAMIRDSFARFNELSVSKAHTERMKVVKEFFTSYKPTISLDEALYRLSFYLIPNKNNLAKSTNHLIEFVKKILLEQSNGLLVDSAILLGGQGKSTVQQGLLRATKQIGFNSTMCHLPTKQDGVQDVFVKNEICIDDESHFEKIDEDSLNKIVDKSTFTIKGKYVKEWSAKSVANILVGTNFLPTDVNDRRYLIRMVDSNFKLEQNYGKWTIPGVAGDKYGTSYEQVLDWTTEAWLNLFYYCNKYDIKEQKYKEMSFDYNLLYHIKKALTDKGSNTATINEMIKYFEQIEDTVFDYGTKRNYKNKLYKLANQLNLEIVGEKKRDMFNEYDWTETLDIDEANVDDPLETVYCYFHNNSDFCIDDSKIQVN